MSLLGIFGEREQNSEVRTNNMTAILSISNILKSSLGPQGLDKMIVNDTGDIVITNDGATILNHLEVEHPAAKILVELAQIQDREVGDGTTSVVLIAAELLKVLGTQLIQNNIHPTTVISGFRMALKESIAFIQVNKMVKEKFLTFKFDASFDKEMFTKVAKTSLNSKLIGVESDYFSLMIVEAFNNLRNANKEGWNKLSLKSINILKNHGKSIFDSKLINGYAIMNMRSSQAMPMIIKKAKIACLDIHLNKFRLPQGYEILISNPENLEKIRLEEMEITKKRCKKIISAGANVILCTKGIDEFALKYFVEAKVMAIRRVPKQDLQKIAKCTNAKVITTLADDNGDEKFDSINLGEAESVTEERIGDNEYILFKRGKYSLAQTIILRGANEYMLDEVERSLNDAISSVKRVIESNSLVVGGGCVETAVGIYLEDFSRTIGSKEQLAITEFAEALYVIPKTLLINAGKDATELLAKLRTLHYTSQNTDNPERLQWKNCGLDLIKGTIRNNYNNGVFEPSISKLKSLKFATEAAITILRIDDLIKISQKDQKNS